MTANSTIAGAQHHQADLGDVQLHYVTLGIEDETRETGRAAARLAPKLVRVA